jgi:hypothetical protein
MDLFLSNLFNKKKTNNNFQKKIKNFILPLLFVFFLSSGTRGRGFVSCPEIESTRTGGGGGRGSFIKYINIK